MFNNSSSIRLPWIDLIDGQWAGHLPIQSLHTVQQLSPPHPSFHPTNHSYHLVSVISLQITGVNHFQNSVLSFLLNAQAPLNFFCNLVIGIRFGIQLIRVSAVIDISLWVKSFTNKGGSMLISQLISLIEDR